MFIGHFAIGLAAKRIEPRVSLAVLFAAVQFADLLWPVLVALGLEQVRIDAGNTPFTPLEFVSYPYSHSLVSLIVWGIAIGVAYRSFVPDARRGVIVLLAVLVVSHWVLDVVTHRPDVPIYPGGPRLGLGLWYSVPATLIVETALYVIGLWFYLRTTVARDAIGRWGFAALAAFLPLAYAAAVGAVPPSVPALYASSIIGGALLIASSWWADRHRDSAVRAEVASR